MFPGEVETITLLLPVSSEPETEPQRSSSLSLSLLGGLRYGKLVYEMCLDFGGVVGRENRKWTRVQLGEDTWEAGMLRY